MTERTLREQIPEMVPSAEERIQEFVRQYWGGFAGPSHCAQVLRELAEICRSDGWNAALSAISSAPITDAEVEASVQAALAEFCQPTIAVAWAELQPAAKEKWRRITRAALTASRKWMGDQK